MKNYRFAEIKEKDLDIILNIYNYYITNTKSTLHTSEISLDDFKKNITGNNSRYKSFSIFDWNKICGFCYISQYKNRTGYDRTAEISVYLKPGYIGKGIGRMAVEYLENIARINCIAVLIATITEDNTNSIRLFEKLGYEKSAHLKKVAEKFGKLLYVLVFQKIL